MVDVLFYNGLFYDDLRDVTLFGLAARNDQKD